MLHIITSSAMITGLFLPKIFGQQQLLRSPSYQFALEFQCTIIVLNEVKQKLNRGDENKNSRIIAEISSKQPDETV